MTPQQQAIFAIIVLALTGGLIIYANTILSKARKIAKEANIKIDLLKTVATYGSDEPAEYFLCKTHTAYDVYATHKAIAVNGVISVLVKRFPFGDDRDFAKLEAQELLDNLKEK